MAQVVAKNDQSIIELVRQHTEAHGVGRFKDEQQKRHAAVDINKRRWYPKIFAKDKLQADTSIMIPSECAELCCVCGRVDTYHANNKFVPQFLLITSQRILGQSIIVYAGTMQFYRNLPAPTAPYQLNNTENVVRMYFLAWVALS